MVAFLRSHFGSSVLRIVEKDSAKGRPGVRWHRDLVPGCVLDLVWFRSCYFPGQFGRDLGECFRQFLSVIVFKHFLCFSTYIGRRFPI